MDKFLITVQRPPESVSPVVAAAAAGALSAPNPTPNAFHSPDFCRVEWFGESYHFRGRLQRAAVAVLWNAWEHGYLDVLERTVLAEADSESDALKDIFKGHPAWGTLIQRSSIHGGPAGAVRLVQPSKEEDC